MLFQAGWPRRDTESANVSNKGMEATSSEFWHVEMTSPQTATDSKNLAVRLS
jgi:hypothetical protein